MVARGNICLMILKAFEQKLVVVRLGSSKFFDVFQSHGLYSRSRCH